MEESEDKVIAIIGNSGQEEKVTRQMEQIAVKEDKGIIIVDSEQAPKMIGAIGEGLPDLPFRSIILAGGMAMAALSMVAMSGMLPRKLFPTEKDFKKCLLPGCEILTTHNGGYCSAEHCKMHTKVKKILNKPKITNVDLAKVRDFGCKVIAHKENDKIVIDFLHFGDWGGDREKEKKS
jgi:hypothetical protein